MCNTFSGVDFEAFSMYLCGIHNYKKHVDFETLSKSAYIPLYYSQLQKRVSKGGGFHLYDYLDLI